jgi:hypothetical protein
MELVNTYVWSLQTLGRLQAEVFIVSVGDPKLKLYGMLNVQGGNPGLVTVILILPAGLQPGGAFKTNGFPVKEAGDPQPVFVQTGKLAVHPPKTCDVLLSVMVWLPPGPQTTLLLKSGNKGTSALPITIKVQPLQVMVAVTPYTPAFA